MTAAPEHVELARCIAAELFPDGVIVETFFDEDAVVLNIDDPANEFELEQLYVWPDGEWSA